MTEPSPIRWLRASALFAVLAMFASYPALAGGNDGTAPTKNKGGKMTAKGKADAPAGTAAKKKEAAFEPLPPFLMLPNQKAAREEVEKSGIAPELVAKMLKGDGLKLEEIEQVAAKGVSDDTLTKYLRSVGATYQLTTKDIDRLRAARVSDTVIDYLLTTPARRPLHFSSWPLFHHDYHHHDHHFDAHHH
jgi:hypothetical protein